uniref:Uncharacterized protein n=1 Tax=Aegilops tauschii subsp. strangulata TaxID=200361 RepID=A0A453EID9_AEGTS
MTICATPPRTRGRRLSAIGLADKAGHRYQRGQWAIATNVGQSNGTKASASRPWWCSKWSRSPLSIYLYTSSLVSTPEM